MDLCDLLSGQLSRSAAPTVVNEVTVIVGDRAGLKMRPVAAPADAAPGVPRDFVRDESTAEFDLKCAAVRLKIEVAKVEAAVAVCRQPTGPWPTGFLSAGSIDSRGELGRYAGEIPVICTRLSGLA